MKRLLNIAAFALILSLFAGASPLTGIAAAASEAAAQNGKELVDEILSARDAGGAYRKYRELHSDKAAPRAEYILNAGSCEPGGGARLREGGEESAAELPENGSAVWNLTVADAGLYTAALKYSYTDTNSINDSGVSLKINGEAPFLEAEAISLPRSWAEEERGIDKNGNEMRPDTVQTLSKSEIELCDPSGTFRELKFHLEQGTNRIEIFAVSGGIVIYSLRLYNEKRMDYIDYKAGLGMNPADEAEFLEAEKIFSKNDPSISSGADRTGPETQPSDPSKLRLNILDGSTWSTPGQTVTWKVNIEKAGRYKIGARYLQDQIQVAVISRRMTLDSEILFSEMETLLFPYRKDWTYTELGADNEIFEFDLTAGEHTITLECVTGQNGIIAREIEDIVYVLNYLYRKIIMVTGTSPDPLRDYYISEQIPILIPCFEEISDRIKAVAGRIEKFSGEKGGQVSVLRTAAYQLDSFVADPYYIQARLESYKSNIGSVSSYIAALEEQPLTLDYLVFVPAGGKVPKTKAGFFEKLTFGLKAFAGSFFNDYNQLAQTGDGKEAITAWYSGGREQAEIVKQLAESDYIAKVGGAVNLQLVQVPLAQAIMAGTAPDVVLNISRSQPVNLGARGVLAELNDYDGFENLKTQFPQYAFVPYSLGERAYGIPVTMEFHLMFYRKDIFAELSLMPPSVWDEFYKLIPALQRKNLYIGLPYTIMSSQGTIDSGIGAKDLFSTLVLQTGEQMYTENESKINFDNIEIQRAFRRWTEFYTKYEFELQFDFYNRFRSGEMPLAIQNYSMYNLLEAAAPEIKNLWGVLPIPGTPREDGTTDRSEATSGTAAVILKSTSKPEESWEFLRWWTSAEIQAEYGIRQELMMGKGARYTPASNGAMELLPWSREELLVLNTQKASLREIPEVVGGYYTARGIDNAFRNVVMNGKNYREAIMEQSVKINAELARKKAELKLK